MLDMQKSKAFKQTAFTTAVIQEAIARLRDLAGPDAQEGASSESAIGDADWTQDGLQEALADLLPANHWSFRLTLTKAGAAIARLRLRVVVSRKRSESEVQVEAPSRAEIEAVFNVFEGHAQECRLPKPPVPPPAPPIVFIGHGRSSAWRDLKDHLQDKQGYQVEAYETGARAGHTIRDVLESMLTKSSFALLVMTGDDATEDGTPRARQNVIHEAGLFQGHLGFSRAVVLREEGVEEFSNIHGVEQIFFPVGGIRQTFGDVVAAIRREFPSS
jgi:hypothetical protein